MSSIFSFDIYGTYINKRATNAQLIKWSHIGVVGSALLISTLSTALYKGGVDLNWLLYFLGILIWLVSLLGCLMLLLIKSLSPGMFPTVLALVWKRQPRIAAIIAPIAGFAAGVSVWVGTAYAYSGEATIKSLGQTLPCLFGNMTSFFVPLPITLVISYLWPQPNFEWSDLLSIQRIEDNEHGKVGTTASHFNAESYFTPERVAYMKRMSRIALYWGIATFAGQWVLWPLPMYGARFIFSKKVNPPESYLYYKNTNSILTAVYCVGCSISHLAVLYAAGCNFLPIGRWRIEEDLARNQLAPSFERRRIEWCNYPNPQRLTRWFGVEGGRIA